MVQKRLNYFTGIIIFTLIIFLLLGLFFVPSLRKAIKRTFHISSGQEGTGTDVTPGTSSGIPAPSGSGNGMLHVQGSQLIDNSGRPVMLRGAMIETSFAYISRWNKGENPLDILNSNTFNAMRSWNMNALRMNISEWIYNLNPSDYMSKLDTAVAQANQAGLYVIIDFHDDTQSGSPHGDSMMHTETLNWWKMIASHFKANAMMLFDLENEPHYPDWQEWAHGNGSTIVGFLDVIAAIRSTGAQQTIVIEPGKAGGNNPEDAGWATFDLSLLTDPNVMPSKHEYQNVISGNPQTWDRSWGPFPGKYPLFYGEWAVLANARIPVHCAGLTSSNADQITNTFLNYLNQRQANWTYWDFEPYRLIQDYTTFTPTNFQTGSPWSCPDGTHAGAGQDIKNYLTNGQKTSVTNISTIPPQTKKHHKNSNF